MKVIVEHDEHAGIYLSQYAKHLEHLDKQHAILDIEDKYVPWLTEQVRYAEPNFEIELVPEQEHLETSLVSEEKIIIAYIGELQKDEVIDVYYDIGTCKSTPRCKIKQVSYELINCYSETGRIDAVNYIKCIDYLCQLSKTHQKPIIIYARLKVPHETYRYRTLTYKIVNRYMATVQGVFIFNCLKKEVYKYHETKKRAYEFYEDTSIYLEECFNEALKKAIPILHRSDGGLNFKEMYKYQRQTGSLYDDVFYETIPPQEYIYVLLNSGNYRRPEYYEALGFQAIPIVDEYSVLYGTKSQFDALSEVLKEEVAPQYTMPIVSHILCYREPMTAQAIYNMVPENMPYQGRGIYIGLITVDAVDYTSPLLRDANGRTRIACIWEQEEAGVGTYYFNEQINSVLDNLDTGVDIPLPEGDSMSTMMLAISGGNSTANNYRGVASEAEFIVARIKPASDAIQEIFGGVPSAYGVTMPDVLIGATRLINFANEERKPLVLCVPFNGNVDPHDGSFTMNQMLSFMAQRTGLTIVIPAGEEADKQHHYAISGPQGATNIFNIRVDKEEQNVVGIMCERFINTLQAFLYPPPSVASEPIDIKRPGITRINQTTIYSSGERFNFSNGAQEILFRIHNPEVGGWRIEARLETSAISKMDIWLAQQELNPYTTIRPSDPFVTVGSTAASPALMSVGGYDKNSMVVLRSSGRGYTWDNRVDPLFVTHAASIVAPCRIGELISISGTLPAASIVCGVIAALYSKFLEEQVFPMPNTLIMNSLILGSTEQFPNVEYPNPSQGYGIFNIEVLRQLLVTPLI